MFRPQLCARCMRSTTSITSSIRSYAQAAKKTQKGRGKNPSSDQSLQPVAATSSSVFAAPKSKYYRTDGNFTVRQYKPITPGIRHLRRPINEHLWKGRPYLKLTVAKKGQGKGGRNNTGRVTVRHRGGGHKRRIRIVDFQRKEPGRHVVERIEHDPNRSAHIALISNEVTLQKSYIIAAEGMREGDVIQSYRAGIPRELIESMGGVIDPGMLAAKTAHRGNCLPIKMVPLGTQVYNIGSAPGRGAVFCRSAGTYGILISKAEEDGKASEVVVRLQSGEIRRVSPNACATVGVASNPHYHFRQLGKAGRSRWLGIRPTVRGLAMNAVDHPHGGGRGKSKGNVIPNSPWGRTPAKSGFKTRKTRNPNPWLVKDRERNQGKRRSKSNS